LRKTAALDPQICEKFWKTTTFGLQPHYLPAAGSGRDDYA
jgi:hypothetical protein